MPAKTWPRPGAAGIPKPSAGDTTPQPMPTTRGAGRELPNGMATFTKEAMKPAQMGQLSVNPGKPTGRK